MFFLEREEFLAFGRPAAMLSRNEIGALPPAFALRAEEEIEQ